MPFPSPGSITAKDANLANQQVATSQGDGTNGDPYVPLHSDIGIGHPSDSIATNTVGDSSVISLAKAVFGRLMAIFTSLGDPGDVPAVNGNGNGSIIPLLKTLVNNSSIVDPTDYQSIGADANDVATNIAATLLSLEALNPNEFILYLQLYDTVGTTTGTPKRVYPVYPNNGLLLLDASRWGGRGLKFTNGITWAFSTTPDTFTLPPIGLYMIFICYVN
jgi:hypothetical protein